jgi:23S rRNA A1618 N6-methylase RlmF
MITQEKFFKALEKIKIQGRWLMGLAVGDIKSLDFGDYECDKIAIGGEADGADAVIKKIRAFFEKDKWIVLEIKKNFPPEIYKQLKLLSAKNRLQLPNGEILRQPDTVRVIVAAKSAAVKAIESAYPDFKYLFGPIITI